MIAFHLEVPGKRRERRQIKSALGNASGSDDCQAPLSVKKLQVNEPVEILKFKEKWMPDKLKVINQQTSAEQCH